MSEVLREMTWSAMSATQRTTLISRGAAAIFDPGLRADIERILDDVRANGDEAVCRALRDFDRVSVHPNQLRCSPSEFEAARKAVGPELLAAIREMIGALRRFNEQLMERKGKDWWFESAPGLFVGEKVTPIASAGLFCPSGKASYPSVLAQIGTPCVVAGVPTRVVITPPIRGRIEVDAATLVVADELGLADVFRVNGPAGVAAVAFGTESIPRCVKVVGPGSPAVTAAQVLAQAHGTATMMLLGPSESLIIADETADPIRLAADLLNEAEHGTDSTALLLTDSVSLLARTQAELARQIVVLPAARHAAASAALGTNGGAILVRDLDEAAEVANAFGPEHMQLAVDASVQQSLLDQLHNAGEILLGQHTTISAANFVIGCPASLPTSGFSAVSSGITVEAFLKRTAVARADEPAMRAMAPAVCALSDHEGFPAHANAQRIRVGGWPSTGIGH